MKHLKIFEEYKYKTPRIGDYVICNDVGNKSLNKFLNNAIGRVIDNFDISNGEMGRGKNYLVEYEELPDYIYSGDFSFGGLSNVRPMFKKEIIYFSSNKEDLEMYINANKYNL